MLLSLLTATALAQVAGPFTIASGVDQTKTVSRSDCATTITPKYTILTTQQVCSNVRFWLTSSECGDAPIAGDRELSAVSNNPFPATGTFDFTVGSLPAFTVDGGTPCGTSGIEVTHKVCGDFQTAYVALCQGTPAHVHATPLTIVYDAKPPDVPVVYDAVSKDTAIDVHFSVGTDATTVHVDLRAAGELDFVRVLSLGTPATTARLTDLQNGIPYEMQLTAVDAVGNASSPSAILSATPQASSGFWTSYKAAGGGAEGGGCAAAPAGASISTAALLWLARRRRQN